MPKKHWIYIKRGFVTDPKHREAIGESVWLYFYILDLANWENGKVYDWKDQSAADEMCLDRRTIIRQRAHLENAGYVKCERGQHGQTITIKKWISPRSYSGETINLDVTSTTHLEEKQNPDVTPDVTPDVQNSLEENALFIESKIIGHSSLREDALSPVIIWKQVTGQNVPIKLHELVSESLTSKPDVEKLRSVFTEWIGHGYRPGNIVGILDWYKSGIPKNGNGRRPAQASAADQVDEYLARLEAQHGK